MGNRSNIAVDSGVGRVYLYAHWAGESVLHSAVRGLVSGRLGDPAYLTRIIFSHMIRDDLESETGFGIGTAIEDNEHPIIVIDGDSIAGTTWFEDEKGNKLTRPVEAKVFLAAVQESLDAGEYDYGVYEKLITRLNA